MTNTAAQTPPLDLLPHALEIASWGLRVVPIAPGKKTPHLTAWQTAASDDEAVIRAWWTGMYRGHGVGIRTGWTHDDRCIVVLDVDTIAHGADGAATLADLERCHGSLPTTMEAQTGSGGRHLYFVADVEVRNSAGIIGPGLDIRGEGGFVVAPPTTHPNGTAYAWTNDYHTTALAPLPAWLLDAATRTPIAPPRQTADHGGNRPGDIYARSVTWAEVLEPDGWTFAYRDRSGEDHWTRPGKEIREGTSATTNYKGSDVLKVFTGSVPTLRDGETYSKLGYVAATRHHGDHKAAARALALDGHRVDDDAAVRSWLGDIDQALPTQRNDAGEIIHGWEVVDLGVVLAGDYDPPVPTVMRTSNGRALFYAGRVNAVQGESGSGKSWIALAAAAEQIADGLHVIYVDLEDHAASIAARLIALGVSVEDIVTCLHYVQPGRSWTRDAGDYLAEIVANNEVGLVVIDSTGEAMSNDSVDQNDDGPVAGWMRRLPRALANLGPCVLMVDHVVKDKEKRGLFAIGSQRKRAAIDGSAFLMEARISPAKGVTGRMSLTCAKDRNGFWRQKELAADVTMHSDGDNVEIVFEGHEVGEPWRPTTLMARIAEHLAIVGSASTRSVQNDVEGNTKTLASALDVMLAEGVVKCIRGGAGKANMWELSTGSMISDTDTAVTAVNRGHTAVTDAGTAVSEPPRSPRSPPLPGDRVTAVANDQTAPETTPTAVKPWVNDLDIFDDGF